MSDSPQSEQASPPPLVRRILDGIWRVAKWGFFGIGCVVTLFVGACTIGMICSGLDKRADWVYDNLAPEEDVEIIDSVHGDYASSYIIRLRSPEAAARMLQEIHKRHPGTGEYAMECDAPHAFSGAMYDRCRSEFGDHGDHYRLYLYGDCPHLHHGCHHSHTQLHIYAAGNDVFYVHVSFLS